MKFFVLKFLSFMFILISARKFDVSIENLLCLTRHNSSFIIKKVDVILYTKKLWRCVQTQKYAENKMKPRILCGLEKFC